MKTENLWLGSQLTGRLLALQYKTLSSVPNRDANKTRGVNHLKKYDSMNREVNGCIKSRVDVSHARGLNGRSL